MIEKKEKKDKNPESKIKLNNDKNKGMEGILLIVSLFSKVKICP